MLSEVSPGHYIIQQNPNQRAELLQAQELAHSGLLIQSASNQSGMILQNTNQPGLLFQNSNQSGLSLQGSNQSNVLFGHNNPSGLVLQQSNASLLQGTGQGGLSFISLNPSNPLAQTIISPLQPLQSHVSPPSMLQPGLGLAPLMQAATLASSQPMLLSQSFLAQTGMFLPQLATQSMVSRQSGMDIGVGQVQQKSSARGSSVVIDPHAHMLSATLNSSILKANQLGISTQNQVQMLSSSRFSAPSTNQMTLPSSTNIHVPQIQCSSTTPAVSHTYTLHSQGTGLSSSNVSFAKSAALPVAPKMISPSTVLAKVDGAPTQVNYMGSFDLNSSSLKTTIHGQPLNKHASEKIMDLVQRALNNKGQEQIPGVEVKSAFTDTPQGPKKVLKVFINEDILPGQSTTRSGPFGQSLPTQTAAPSTTSSVVASLLSTMQLNTSSTSRAGPEASWTKILPSSSQVPVGQQQCQPQTQSQEGASLWSGTNTGYISVPIGQNLSGSRQHGSIKPHPSAPFRRALKPAIYPQSLKRTFSQLSAQSTHDEPAAKRPIFGKTLNNDGIVTGSFQQIVGRNLLVETPTTSSETSNVLNNAQENLEVSQFRPSQGSTDGNTGQLPTIQPTEGQHQPHHIAQQQIHLQQSPHKRASFPLMSPIKRPTTATHPVNAIKERARKQILKQSLMKKEAFSPSSGQGFKPPEVAQRKKSVVSRRLKTVSHHPLIHHKKGNVTLPQPTLEEEVVATPLDLGKDHPHGPGGKAAKEKNVSRLKFEISSDDGFSCQGDTVEDAWNQVLEKVQDVRAASRMKQLSYAGISGRNMFGVDHDAVVYLIEQLYGAVHCHRNYKFKFHKYDLDQADAEVTLNPSGAARSETFGSRKPFDMFNFLKSMYRTKPGDDEREKEEEMALKSSRRATSLSLPMAMRFRKLKTFAKEAVDVYRSKIHGRGLFCKRNIDAGEMVIEYAGEVIRASLTDKREKYYESRGIGCYMFRIDDDEVVDATMHGSAARFINHSCEPNCFSKVILVDGKKHIVIFAMRPIKRGEELTYDYKFPIEEVKIPCSCGSKRCRKYLN
ncbi:unnamed protein product [Lymnaea stagnalis]|uniref:Uncharacterized protein n=1 Tax=Lymnaea stagnalis TaxID=6523 RepID=A0AAV2III2_LYMST